MEILRKKLSVIAGLLVLFSMMACKKWVSDARQPLGVDDAKVFSTEQGFREVLNGVYLQMGDSTLYGKELTMGVLSLAGRNYDSVSVKKVRPLYYNAAIYNFTDPKIKDYTNDVWNKMYKAIANLNNLLYNLELRKTIFTGNNYNTYKGEALALRAYLHFDLLRLFASIDAGTPGIPYVTTIDFNETKAGTVGNTLEQCIADLSAADALLAADNMSTSQITKWAVKGLLARVYLYKGDTGKANENALAVIDSKKFELSVNTNSDLFFNKENIFTLYIYSNNYYAYYKAIFGAPSLIGLSVSGQSALYGSTVTDYRKSFIDATTGAASGVPLLPKKFTVTASNIFPMVRLTEMYYIAAECAADVSTGLSYINKVRVSRNLTGLTAVNVPDPESLSKEIMNEYRKEFLGEGQVFFYYKRKNIPFNALPFYPKVPAVPGEAYLPVASNATYTFVKPE
ncbi:RagB/SusD family nutrient uptake outer membrane protein [Pedobacter nyackensis]|uniref:RagB/SusD family nutrient uptake outer membrane protein n=1 Tax=Pedobacter nyackensis TaxID=475255 RepID=UPI002931E8CD|nr:RagB/SusD family nutrient uptake outer membrane protein [Pedobacter nyackensis]